MRLALYFTPDQDHPLTRAASRWLGRDAFDAGTFDIPAAAEAAGLDPAAWTRLTAEPRRYGFHATLKAPFALAEGTTAADVTAALHAFADRTAPVRIERLAIRRIGRFFALVPDPQDQSLQDLAQQIVEAFEPFRAPLSAAALARRKPESLSDRQRAYLDRFGYPYVGEEFQFHMTLTGAVDEAEIPAVTAALHRHFAGLDGAPQPIDRLALFGEAESGSDFTVLSIVPLAGRET